MHACMYVCMVPLIDLARLYAGKWIPDISVENKNTMYAGTYIPKNKQQHKTQCMLESPFQKKNNETMYAGKSIPEQNKNKKTM